MRHQLATVHELARIAELAGVPGETLARLAERMERQELASGEQFDANDRFAVVLSGMVSGDRGVLRPGDSFRGRVSAVIPASIASCERGVYEELIVPR